MAEKSGVTWCRQPVTIKQKSYSIRSTDRPPNCIKFFCENLDLDNPLSFRPLFVTVKLSSSLDVFAKVEYDDKSKLFTITFPSHNPLNRFTFENLDQILRTVLEQIALRETSADAENLVFIIDFFDFTCYDTIFPQDGRLMGLTWR